MIYLRKIFENENSILDPIESEISNIKDIIVGLSDNILLKAISVDYAIYELTSVDEIVEGSLYNMTDGTDDDIQSVGYEIHMEIFDMGECIKDDSFSHYVELITEINNVKNRINSLIQSDSGVRLDDNIVINFIKNNPNIEDYYYCFNKIIGRYSDEESLSNYRFNIKNINLVRNGQDYFLYFSLYKKEASAIKQIRILKDYCESYFEKITYDEFIKIDDLKFKLKNPKIESIKF